MDNIKELTTRLRRLERGEGFLRGGAEVSPSGTRGRPLRSVLLNGRIDPRSSSFVTKGSLAGVIFPSFTATVTSSSISWAWAGPLRRADGSIQAIAASSLTVTGLAASTKYYFYPFFATRGCGIGFVAGNSGSPAFAHSQNTDAAAAQQNLQDREPLSSGAMYATTLAGAGTSTSYGGGSTGDIVGGTRPGGCPRSYMVVESKLRGVVRCEELLLGERIASPDGEGWTDVVDIQLTPCDAFVCITTDAGDEIEISPETPQPLFDDDDKPASLLSLTDRAMVRQPGGGSGYITGLRYVEESGVRAVMVCNPSHRFWCGRHSPMIAAHNYINKNLL